MNKEVYIKIGNKTITLAGNQELLIGRKKHGADIEIDPSVGRKHGLVERKGKKIYIKDLESLNGIYVNDKRIESNKWIEVTIKDKIKIVSEFIKIALEEDTFNEENRIVTPKKEDKQIELKNTTDFKQKISTKGVFNLILED